MATKFAGKHPGDPALVSFYASLFGTQSEAGVNVTPDIALTYSAWFSGVTGIARIVSMLPFIVYKRLPGGGKERDFNHNLFQILHEKPNRYQTPLEFKSMMQICILQRGNGYAEIVPTGGRAVSEVLPLNPDRVTPFWAPDGTRAYEVHEPNGSMRILLQDEMWHIMGPSLDGLKGLNPIEFHRRTLGKSIAAEIYQARFFKHNALPDVVLEVPGKMTPESSANLRNAWDRRHADGQSHRTGIVWEGVKVHEMGMSHEDAQYLSLLKNGVADVARILHLPLHMLAEMDRATFSNIEQQSLEFVTYSLMYWLVTWEQSARRDLFTDADRRTHVAEFLVAALLRGDIKARYEAYALGRQNTFLSANEIRAFENLNPIEGGDVYENPNIATNNSAGAEA